VYISPRHNMNKRSSPQAAFVQQLGQVLERMYVLELYGPQIDSDHWMCTGFVRTHVRQTHNKLGEHIMRGEASLSCQPARSDIASWIVY